MKKAILIILLLVTFLTQAPMTNWALVNAEETEEYYIKIIKVTSEPSPLAKGDHVTFSVEFEYNLPEDDTFNSWDIGGVLFYKDKDNVPFYQVSIPGLELTREYDWSDRRVLKSDPSVVPEEAASISFVLIARSYDRDEDGFVEYTDALNMAVGESGSYHVKIVDVTTEPSTISSGDLPKYWVNVEYDLPRYDSIQKWQVYVEIDYYDENGIWLDSAGDNATGELYDPEDWSGSAVLLVKSSELTPVPDEASSIKIFVWAGGWWTQDTYNDTTYLYLNAQEQANRLQILTVDYPFSVEPGEEFAVNVEFEYDFSKSTAVSIGIFDIDSDNRIDIELFDLEGRGTEVASFVFRAPDEEMVLHLSADGYYQKDDIWVHDEEGWYQDFNIEVKSSLKSSLSLKASVDKDLYLTNEIMVIKGEVTYGSEAAYPAWIDLKIYLPDGTVDTWSGGTTDTDGSYEVEYPVPKISFSKTPPEPEELKIDVIASYVVNGEITVRDTQTITINVLPVYIKFNSLHLVQIIETPYIDGRLYLAAGREAGLRAIISCPSLKGTNLASKPRVKVEFYIENAQKEIIKKIEKEVEVGADPTPVDFIFTLPEGQYLIGALVDPNFNYMSPTYFDEMFKAKLVHVKNMKRLIINFVPIFLDLEGDDLQRFVKFCREQSDFMKEVYPLPESNFKFVMETKSINWISFVNWIKLSTLSLRSYFIHADKYVGVLNEKYWDPGVEGFSTEYMYGLVYYKRAVLVKYGCSEGVTSHEVGHTLGLNIRRGVVQHIMVLSSYEEYDIYPPFGKKVDGLILKNGRIFNLSQIEDRLIVSGYPESKIEQTINAGIDKNFYCFMGNNLMESWVCDETYRELFKSLMDPPIEKTVYVSGAIFKNGTVILNNFYVMDGEPDLLDGENYTIQCVSSTGKVLYSADFGWDTEDLFFGFAIPYPDGTSAIVIKKGDDILKEVRKTPNAPTVTVEYPNGGEAIDGEVEIQWRAEDLDGDNLYYSVLYSYDGGETWIADALELNETSYTLDVSKLPGGNKCKIRIIATDGFNTAIDDSDNFFSVTDKPPLASIDSLSEGDTYQLGEEVKLQATAYDLEDGFTDLNIEWSSNIDGILGYGEELHLTELSPGRHIITLRVTDSTGKPMEKRIAINITKSSQISVLEHTLCKSVDQNGEPVEMSSIFSTNENVVSWLDLVNVSVGDEVVWVFEGPNNISEVIPLVSELEGEAYYYAMLDLHEYDPASVQGQWMVNVFLNGEHALTQQFTIEGETQEESNTLEMALGFLILASPVVAIAAVIRYLIKRRKK